jgi:hypothetical protein
MKASFAFFHEHITSNSFLDMLERCGLPQLNNNNNSHIPQLDGAPVHFAHVVSDCLKVSFVG